MTGSEAPPGEGRGLRAGFAYLLAGPFLALTPITVFLAHAGYPFLAPEALLCQLVIAALGLACGALMAIRGSWIRIGLAAGLISLVVDFQTDLPSALGLRKTAFVVMAITAACWLLRRRLGQVLALIGGTVWVTSFLGAASPPWQVRGEAAAGRGDLAPFVQLILDEHVGIEGIPREFDESGAIADNVSSALVERGFTVFTRAYSRYYNTGRSIPAALNFMAPEDATVLVDDVDVEPIRMRANATVSLLHERGYRVHVVQSDFLDLCTISGESVADECASYRVRSILAIRALPIGALAKAAMILDMFRGLSEVDKRLRRALGWPGPRRVSSIATLGVADAIASMLGRAQPGDAYLVHFMLPHFPLVYDAECRLRSEPSSWMNNYDPNAAPRRNTPESRRVRYGSYLDQLACTQKLVFRMLDALEAAGVYDRSTVVIHGDHGSRIDTAPPVPPYLETLAPQDYLDAFSTLFAARLPGVPGGMDRRALPLEELLGAVVRDERLPPESAAEAAWVWVVGEGGRLERRPLPRFAHGRVEDADAPATDGPPR